MITKIFDQPLKFQLLVIESLILLFVARSLVLILPFKTISGSLGEFNKETKIIRLTGFGKKIKHIENAIYAVSKYTVWKSNCLAQAICCHWMLKRRKIPYTIYMGVKYDENKQLLAHAWTRVGNKVITGATGHRMYTVTGKFAFNPNQS